MVYFDGVHLVATTIIELHEFAARLGMRRSWFQSAKWYHPHYDILSISYKQKAIDLGALPVTGRRINEMFLEGVLERLPDTDKEETPVETGV